MGFYTKFRFIGELKEEYYDFMKYLYENNLENFWHEFAKKYEWANHFSNLSGCDLLTFCPIEYSSGCFKENQSFELRIEGHWTSILILEINTEFKNYNDEIKYFMEEIIPNICEKVYLAIFQDEEMDYPYMYK